MNLKKLIVCLLILFSGTQNVFADKFFIRSIEMYSSDLNDKQTGSFSDDSAGQIEWTQTNIFSIDPSRGWAFGYEKSVNKSFGFVFGYANLGRRELWKQEAELHLEAVDLGETIDLEGYAFLTDTSFDLSMPLFLQLKYYPAGNQVFYLGLQAHLLNIKQNGDWGNLELKGNYGYGFVTGFDIGFLNIELAYLTNKYTLLDDLADKVTKPNAEETVYSLSLGCNFYINEYQVSPLEKINKTAYQRKTPVLAASLGFFLPSFGHYYVGDWFKGFGILALEGFLINKSLEQVEYTQNEYAGFDPNKGTMIMEEKTYSRPIDNAASYAIAAAIVHLWQTYDAYKTAEKYNEDLEEKIQLEIKEQQTVIQKRVFI